PQNAGVVRPQEADERDQEQAGVEPVRAVVLDERAAVGVVALAEHRASDLLPDRSIAVDRALAVEALNGLHGSIERDPGHHLGVREVTSRAAHLPDSLVGFTPAGLEPVEELAAAHPGMR